MTPERLQLAADLAVPESRATAARALASEFGAEALLIFTRDTEIDALLPAPGFPQTLPNGKLWREFAGACVERGDHRGRLTFGSATDDSPAIGFAKGRDIVVVLIGTEQPRIDVEWLRTLLPMLAGVFHGERMASGAAVKTRQAWEAATRSTVLAETLDRTRRRLEESLQAARDARAEVDRVNARLEIHAGQLESANARLREQAEELEAQAMELEAQAEELQLANAELFDARKAADSANLAKSEFLATMSHELRTPLNAIGGHVQLLEMGVRGPITEEQRDALMRIDRSQRHLLGLINDILNLSRIEAGKVDYVMTDVPLRAALADLAPMIDPQLAAKSLSLEVHDPDGMPTVRADCEKLQQILLNLLSNAVKFTKAGGRIWIDATQRDGVAGKVFIRVSDTGLGIPEPKIETIFEPFTQVDASHSRLGQGAGLGLSISRDLARGMGGELRVRSELGVGSTFTLTLDLAQP